jgi:hypothetical protein
VAMTDNGKECVRIQERELENRLSMNLIVWSIVVLLKWLFWTMVESEGIVVAWKILYIDSLLITIYPFFYMWRKACLTR